MSSTDKFKNAVENAKNFLSVQGGFYSTFLQLKEVVESDNKWIIKFDYTAFTETAVLQVDVDMEKGEIVGFRRVG